MVRNLGASEIVLCLAETLFGLFQIVDFFANVEQLKGKHRSTVDWKPKKRLYLRWSLRLPSDSKYLAKGNRPFGGTAL